MTDEERLYILAIMAVWAVVWVCIVAVLKARQSKKEKKEEREYMENPLLILPYISNTDFWIGMSIWWPVLLVLSPFYLLYKAVFKIAKSKEE